MSTPLKRVFSFTTPAIDFSDKVWYVGKKGSGL